MIEVNQLRTSFGRKLKKDAMAMFAPAAPFFSLDSPIGRRPRVTER